MKMKKPFLLFILILSTNLIAAPDIATKDDFDNFVNSYYLNPKPELISQAVNYLCNDNTLRLNAIPPIIGFFNYIFHSDEGIKKNYQLNKECRNNGIKDVLLFAFNTKPEDIVSKIKPTASGNDLCWGYYLASGDEKFLKILLNHARYADSKTDIVLFSAGVTARWSLCSNARQHKSVRLFLDKQLEADKKNEVILDILSREPNEYFIQMRKNLQEQTSKGVWTDEMILKYKAEKDQEIRDLFINNVNK